MENSYSNPNPQEDLLTDLTIDLQQASAGKRFANYLIDLVIFYVFAIIFFAVLIAKGVIDTGMNSILDRLITLICYGIFMGIVEAIFKGKSLGKLITGTLAVNEDGSPISAQTAFMRGLSRSVPFEAFSAFGGYPWHDRWTRTYVIDENRSVLPK
jgi:uncharacterized RDD family membrane protein YckC